jgi:C4-dicarboxylate-specific signal transduction histidine kinase
MTDTLAPRLPFWHESFSATHAVPNDYVYHLTHNNSTVSLAVLILSDWPARAKESRLSEQAIESFKRLSGARTDLWEFLSKSAWEGEFASVQESLDRVVRFTRTVWERSCRVERDDPPQLPEVQIPQSWLNRMFFGLVLDALAAMRSRAPQQHVLRLSTRASEQSVRVTISATGPGLPPWMMPHLFEPLCPPPVPGTGHWLGLYRLRALVEAVGGALQVESQPNQGVTFRVYLPIDFRFGEGPPPRPLEEPQLRALQNDELNAARAVVALTAEEVLTQSTSLRSLLMRIARLQNEEEKEKKRKVLNRGFQALRRLRAQARNLRLSRYVQPEPPLPVYVETCLAEALRMTRGQLPRTVRVEEDLAPEPSLVLGSAGYLLRVFLHLLRGSLHTMRHDPSRQHVLRVRSWREESWSRVVLSGPVIPPRKQPYFLKSGIMFITTSEAAGDYSLPGSQAIVEAMGGELRIDSEEGGGLTYSVRLPVAEQR